MLRTDGPNPLTSHAYAKDFNEVKEVGSLRSATRTADQTEAAIFCQDHGPAVWNRILRALAASRGLDVADSARLFALDNLAAADAAIGCSNDKAYWSVWRPISAIREAATDGNPATDPDPTWLPLFDPSTGQFRIAARHPRLPRPGGSRLRQRGLRADGTELLRHRQRRLQRLQQPDPHHEELRQLLRRARGGHQRAGLGWDPLPDGGRAGAALGAKVARWEQHNYFQPLH